jgi:uncharacterized membrane protein
MKRSIGPARLVIAFVAIALTGFATLAEAQTASANPPHYANAPHYTVINLGTLGGSTSYGSGVTNNGWVNGDSYLLPASKTEHAVLWRPDAMGQFKSPTSARSEG